MNARQLYAIFAAPSHPWSPWTKPILFAEMASLLSPPETILPAWHGPPIQPDCAWILDLPGIDGISAAMAGLASGLIPVPLYNGTTGRAEIVDTAPLLGGLLALGEAMARANLPPGAPPMFMLDANRYPTSRTPQPGQFDNRWLVFPQDLPSSRFLQKHGVRVIRILTHQKKISEDLAHVLRRWQDGGIRLEILGTDGGGAKAIRINRPSKFRYFFRRALVLLKLRRGAGGGFGAVVPVPSESSGHHRGFG